MATQRETWRNSAEGTVFLMMYGARGEVRHNQIRGNQQFEITPDERRMNQDAVADESMDPFLNGMFEPVRLIDDEEDYAKLKDNPEIVSETEMGDLLSSETHFKHFETRVAQISNPFTLGRLLSVAKERDASHKRVEKIVERLREIAPVAYVEAQVVDINSGAGDVVQPASGVGEHVTSDDPRAVTARPVTPRR